MRHIIVCLILTTGLVAQEDIKKEIAVAAVIPNSIERLAAYDAIAVKYKLSPVSNTRLETNGKWRIKVDISPIDDSQTVIGSLEADTPVKVRFGMDKPVLIVRYKEGDLSAYIVYDTFLGSDDIDVTLRFGKENPINQKWSISTDHKAMFTPGDVNDFLKKLGAVDSLVVRVTPYSESSVTVLFSPTGIQTVTEAIAKASEKK